MTNNYWMKTNFKIIRIKNNFKKTENSNNIWMTRICSKMDRN